uniref:Grh/CP2 DB domain-containing protein n=1 Tax=Plectus sambesii TaxID=2011161 RepID=A0A914XU30_9BILA
MVFVKIALLSTHFTQKKQGGEKGVPFRLLISTFTHDGGETKQVHAAYAQIRVFKLKGADRKNKTDRERAEKHNDREHFQPAYDYTIFTDSYPLEAADLELPSNDKETSDVVVSDQLKESLDSNEHTMSPIISAMTVASSPLDGAPSLPTVLNCDANVLATNDWLKLNGFAHYLHIFEHFNAVDLLRLSQQDLERLCRTAAEGVRLFNALHAKPRLTIFVRRNDVEEVHTAFFLRRLTVTELRDKLKELLKEDLNDVPLVVAGPRDITVIVTNELISNWTDMTIFSASVVGVDTNRRLILRETVNATSER